MKVEILQNGKVVETREFGDGSWKIGRAPDCHIRLKSAQISKQHALLVIKDERAAIVDLGSSNGVFVNGILIRKQRVNPSDEIHIVDFELRLGDYPRKPKSQPAPERTSEPVAFDGNAAVNLRPEPSRRAEPPPAPDQTPQEKFLYLVDQKVLIPFYQVMKTCDWRWMLSSILMIALVASVLLSVIPVVRWGKSITTQEALARAHTVVSQAVRENYRILTKTNDTTRLTVEACEAEKGILACYIIDPKTSSIWAPTKFYSKSISDASLRENVYPLIAMKKVSEGKEEQVSVLEEGSRWVVAQPIYIYSEESKERVLTAVVLAHFEVPSSISSTWEPLVEAALFAMLLSLLAYFFIYKMFTHPILQLQEQLDSALKGEDVAIRCESKFEELENLAQVMNFAIGRLKQSGVGLSQQINNNDPELEDGYYLSAVAAFDQGTTDGLVLLTREKLVKFVGKAAEDLLSMRSQYANGQNISDACRDQSFAGTAIELTEKVISSLGDSQQATLDINGISRTIVAVPHKNSNGEIRHILLTIKLGAA